MVHVYCSQKIKTKTAQLQLKNGKQRELKELKSAVYILEVKKFFKDIGIVTNELNIDTSKI